MRGKFWETGQACLAREVTKLHEEFRRGKLSELMRFTGGASSARGNYFADRAGRCGGGAGESGFDAEFIGASGRVDTAGEIGSQRCVETGGQGTWIDAQGGLRAVAGSAGED